MNKYLLSFYIFSIISAYILYIIKFVSNGEIGSIGFELLQLLYSIKATIIVQSLCSSYIASCLLHPVLVITIVHILRLIIKRKEILKISKSNKHKKIDMISMMYIYFILYKGIDNKINIPESIKPYILGYIYFLIAKSSFENDYNNKNNTTDLYLDIPVTVWLFALNILHLLNKINIDSSILPVVFGDCLYHIYEVYNAKITKKKIKYFFG